MEEKNEIFELKDVLHIVYITYEESIKLIEYFENVEQTNDIKKIKEKSEEYECKLNEKKIYNKHDKIFKDLLGNKEEAVKFINRYLGLKSPIKSEELERYTNSYITKIYENKEADIVYKVKNKEIFFLIEHQSTIDKTMPYRILNYINAIVNSAVNEKKMRKKDYKFPNIIPIVLYTGNAKWNVPLKYRDGEEELLRYDKEMGEYNLVDTNLYDNEILLYDDSLVSKAMLIEKGKTKEEIVNSFKIVINILEKLEISDSEHLIKVMKNYMLNDVLDSKDKMEINNMLNKKDGESAMLNCARVINEENERLVKKGRREGIKEGMRTEKTNIIINMMKNKLTDEQIKTITGVGDKELSRIKKLQSDKN